MCKLWRIKLVTDKRVEPKNYWLGKRYYPTVGDTVLVVERDSKTGEETIFYEVIIREIRKPSPVEVETGTLTTPLWTVHSVCGQYMKTIEEKNIAEVCFPIRNLWNTSIYNPFDKPRKPRKIKGQYVFCCALVHRELSM